ncbi:hypothetical protein EJB05_35874, partial [Eragrostis curvula]
AGLTVDDECKLKFVALKDEHAYRYITFRIDEKKKQIIVDELANRSPDTSKPRSKMVYTSSKDRFRRELVGIQVELQATDLTEMSLEVFRDHAC